MPTRIKEFYSIQPIETVQSILAHGILSHDGAAPISHLDLSLAEVQEKRRGKIVPNGLPLHQYANLYFDARNPMMYKLVKNDNPENLCVLRITKDILKIEGIVVADKNASSKYVRFLDANQLNELELDNIYAENWNHPDDKIEYDKHRSLKCAEILVPKKVDPKFIFGAYTVNNQSKDRLSGLIPNVVVNSNFFFK